MAFWYRVSKDELKFLGMTRAPLYAYDPEWHADNWQPPPGPARVVVVTDRQRAAVLIPGHKHYSRVKWFKKSNSRDLYLGAIKDAHTLSASLAQNAFEIAGSYTFEGYSQDWPFSSAAQKLVYKSAADGFALEPAVKACARAVIPSMVALIKALIPADKVLEPPSIGPRPLGSFRIENPEWNTPVINLIIRMAVPWSVCFCFKSGKGHTPFLEFHVDTIDLVALTRARIKEVQERLKTDPTLLSLENRNILRGFQNKQLIKSSNTPVDVVFNRAMAKGIIVIDEPGKNRTAEFKAVIKKQLANAGRGFPRKNPCHAQSRDTRVVKSGKPKGDDCMPCPLCGVNNDRYLVCGAQGFDTPNDILRRRLEEAKHIPDNLFQSLLLPPCLRDGKWSLTNKGRFEVGIMAALQLS